MCAYVCACLSGNNWVLLWVTIQGFSALGSSVWVVPGIPVLTPGSNSCVTAAVSFAFAHVSRYLLCVYEGLHVHEHVCVRACMHTHM